MNQSVKHCTKAGIAGRRIAADSVKQLLQNLE